MSNNCGRCGDDLRRGEVTIYEIKDNEYVPKEVICHKCAENDRLLYFQKTGTLNIRLITSALLQRMDEVRGHTVPNHVFAVPTTEKRKILRARKDIDKAVKDFERTVWFGGLQEYIQKAEWKGHSANAYGVKVMAYAMAGRVMITMEKGNATVTVITAEDEKHSVMGLQSVDATLFQAVQLLKEAARNYQHIRFSSS